MSLLIFAIGAILGSFILLVGTRLPINENVMNSRSICDECKKTLRWYNLIPLFSFIFQLGKCSYCKKKINLNHFIVELTMAIGFLIFYNIFGLSYMFYMSIILYSLFMIIAVSDFKYYIILDSPLILSSLLIVILQFIYYDLTNLGLHILSGLAMFAIFISLKKLGDILFKKESLGGGDIKLAFVIGLALGFKLSLIAIILATFLALPASFFTIIKNEEQQIPFGPFLAGALLIVFIFQEKFSLLFYLLI